MSEKTHLYAWKFEQQQVVWTWSTEDRKFWSFLLVFSAHVKLLGESAKKNLKKTKTQVMINLYFAFVIFDDFPIQISISLFKLWCYSRMWGNNCKGYCSNKSLPYPSCGEFHKNLTVNTLQDVAHLKLLPGCECLLVCAPLWFQNSSVEVIANQFLIQFCLSLAINKVSSICSIELMLPMSSSLFL